MQGIKKLKRAAGNAFMDNARRFGSRKKASEFC
jgi:hypothetical protein